MYTFVHQKSFRGAQFRALEGELATLGGDLDPRGVYVDALGGNLGALGGDLAALEQTAVWECPGTPREPPVRSWSRS